MNEERNVKLTVHHSNDKMRIFGTIVDAFTGELMVSATLDYCLNVAIERNYRFVR
jgi:hypothetical protein